MSGFGLGNAGLFPFGFNSTDTTLPVKVKTVGTKNFSQTIRDYVINEDGGFEGTNQTRQRVILALLTSKGSSTVLREFGNKILSLGYKVKNAEKVVDDYVRQALSELVNENKIIITNIESDFSQRNKVVVRVDYINNDTQNLENVTQLF